MKFFLMLTVFLGGCASLEERCTKDIEARKYPDMAACKQADQAFWGEFWSSLGRGLGGVSNNLKEQSARDEREMRSRTPTSQFCPGMAPADGTFSCPYTCMNGVWVRGCR